MKIKLPPLDFMQPELLDEDRSAWPKITFTVDQKVGPSGYTTVVVSGEVGDVARWLWEYCDEDFDLVTHMLDEAS